MTNSEVLIRMASTPNPNAWKFILDRPVMLDGKASFHTKEECLGNRLAEDLLAVPGVKHIHFFSNVITVTHFEDAEWSEVRGNLNSVIQKDMPEHNPNFNLVDAKKEARKTLSPELQKIEEILDRTIRPGLQGDGGDIEVVKFENNQLYVHYQGACGTCPSSTSGTLMAIEGIISDEYGPGIEVIPV